MIGVVHLVAYGNSVAPCGWSVVNGGPDRTSTSWYYYIDDEPLQRVTCPDCVAHARSEYIYPPPDIPAALDPVTVERWLSS